MNTYLQLLADQFEVAACGEALLTLSEGLVKVRVMEAALDLGWTLQEGAGTSPSGPIADFATKVDGEIEWVRGERKIALTDGSADVAVVRPLQLLLEIKARPDVGTKSQAQFQEMMADIRRILVEPRAAFWFVFDPKIYLSFSGEKLGRRGRPSKDNLFFNRTFPPYDDVRSKGRIARLAVEGDVSIEMHFRSIAFRGRQVRVLAFGTRAVEAGPGGA